MTSLPRLAAVFLVLTACSTEGEDADPSWWDHEGGSGGAAGSGGNAGTGGSSTSGGTGAAPTGGAAGSGGSTGDTYEADRIAVVDRINELRAGKSLPAYTRWIDAEPCADLQAEDDSVTGIPHNAWKTGVFDCPGGDSQNECPGWGGPGCVDAMWGEGSLPDCANCDFCEGDHGCDGCDFYGSTTGTTCGHYENLSATSYTRVAVGFGGGWMLINFD